MDRFWPAPELLEVLGDWPAGTGPLYRRLAAAVRAAVDSGDLASGDRLPSERDLARAVGVSRATVVAAYDELRGQSIVDSRRGSGTRIVKRVARRHTGRVRGGTANAIVQRLVAGGPGVISLGQATEPGLPLLAAEIEGLVRDELVDLLTGTGYRPYGLERLREAVAGRYTAAGLPTSAEQIVVTTGATQALALATQLLAPRGATVLTESPSWPGCLDCFRAAGARVVGVPLDDEGIRPDLLAQALTQHRPDLIYLIPTCHNPTGVLMSAPRRRQVADLAARHGVTILEDSPEPDLGPVALGAPGTVLTVGSLTKVVWGGLRIGWVRAPADVAVGLARLKALADLGSPILDQALAARIIPRLDELAVHRERLLAQLRADFERDLAARLPTWRWRRPHGGSSLWVELPEVDGAVFAQIALRHGVEVVPGAVTDPSGAHDRFIRVGFGYPPGVLEQLAGRLAAAWDEVTA